jgi:hypothetical protein
MANKFTYQVLRDTTTEAIIKITGTFGSPTADEINVARISANSLSGALNTNGGLLSAGGTPLPYYDLQLTGLKYYVNFPVSSPLGSVEVYWSGNNATGTSGSAYANSATIFHLQGQGEFGLGEQLPSITNNSGNTVNGILAANTVGNGDLGIQTLGASANSSYTIIISMRKNNAMYQRGQFNDPAAFNYGTYSLQPR